MKIMRLPPYITCLGYTPGICVVVVTVVVVTVVVVVLT